MKTVKALQPGSGGRCTPASVLAVFLLTVLAAAGCGCHSRATPGGLYEAKDTNGVRTLQVFPDLTFVQRLVRPDGSVWELKSKLSVLHRGAVKFDRLGLMRDKLTSEPLAVPMIYSQLTAECWEDGIIVTSGFGDVIEAAYVRKSTNSPSLNP